MINVDGGNISDQLVSARDALGATVEEVKEFQVLTNNYNAEYGQAGNVILNVVTKSGTNSVHGDLAFLFPWPQPRRFRLLLQLKRSEGPRTVLQARKRIYRRGTVCKRPPFLVRQLGKSGARLARNAAAFQHFGHLQSAHQ